MLSILVTKQQFRSLVRLWQKQQLQVISSAPFHNLIPSTSHCEGDRNARAACSVVKVATLLPTRRSSSREIHGAEKAQHAETEAEDDEDIAEYIFNLRHLIYSEGDDIMDKLNACATRKELLDAFKCHKMEMGKEHFVQTVIVLWMLTKNSESGVGLPSDRPFLDTLMESLSSHIKAMNLEEISACYLYLRKMGVENTHPLQQQLLMRSLHEVEVSPQPVSLPALSRLVVGIKEGRDFFIPFLCANFLRHIERHVDICNKEEDARRIAICMIHLHSLICSETLEKFKKQVQRLVDCNEISENTPKTVLKIVNMLNLSVWSQKHVAMIRELLLLLVPVVDCLDANDLKNVSRIYHYHMEPARMQEPLARAVENLLAKNVSAETLASFVPFAQPQRRESLINAFKAVLSSNESWEQPNASGFLFSTLRGLKISDPRICHAFWNRVLSELDEVTPEEMQTKFLRHCHRYMNFNNNLGGTYRHTALEKKLSQLCMSAIEYDVAGRIPQAFARLASFVLAYGHTPYSYKKYPNILLSKIINMADQFTPNDFFVLCRGLQISLEMRYRFQMPQLVGMQLATIDSVITSGAERFLSQEQLSVQDLNLLVRCLSVRKTLKNSVVYHKTLERYKEVSELQLSSRVLREMTYNFMATNYLVPEMLDKMFAYLETNHEHVLGETVEKLLTCAYNLGYTPTSCDALQYAGLILLRDFDYMSGLSLVQACLALCYYKMIPEDLINRVFCVNFIQRVEDEIQMCYSKATYPERVLNVVMQLNRSVCLDFPEANVPWFQQNFIEAQISKRPYVDTTFGGDVRQLLSQLLKGESYFRCNHTTPYGYQIDFVINFDSNKKPMEGPVETTMLDRITKVAILLLRLDSFCANDLSTLRGPDSLKIKHLEMMGYKVLHINEHDWNSKYMNIPGAKAKYLKCLLQISS